MKLFAHSQIPVNPLPYTHLGYVAAAPMNMTLYGCMGLAIAWFIGYHFLTKLPKTVPLRIAGASFYAIGLLSLLLGFHYAGIAAKEVFNYRIINGLQAKIGLHAATLHATDTRSLQRELGLEDAEIRDAWSRELRFTRIAREGQLEFSLCSAGHDGRFDTADDIIQKRSFTVEATRK